MSTPGTLFRKALASESPLQIVGCIHAYAALLAEQAEFRAIYLSGSGVASSSYGLPDLGMTTLDNVLEDVRRITGACSLPLLVDIDTGWGGELMIERTIREMIRAGAAAVHLEDQVSLKRCGHRPDKTVVSTEEMVSRIQAAVAGKTDPNFVIMARTDALASEGVAATIERCIHYKKAGADMLFLEALTDLDQYKAFKNAVDLPILANMTEFGKTQLYTTTELASSGVDMVLYPLSANRAMNHAAKQVFESIRSRGTQKDVVPLMETREELYETLHYHSYEERINQELAKTT